MATLYPKKVNGKTYYYLREMARVDGKPRMVSERYLGSAADIVAALDRQEQAIRPERTRHLAFGAVAAAWGVLTDLDVAGLIDEVVGPRRPDAGASVGAYLVLAALNRLVAPCSKLQFAAWWATTAADRFTRIGSSVLDHRKFWDAMHAVTAEQLEEVSARLAVRIAARYRLDLSSVSLDMTNFATFIDSANDKAPIAQRGKAKQKRTDLRLVGLGLVVTRDGGIPLTWHAYPGNKPDVTQFATMLSQLRSRYTAIRAAAAEGPAAAEASGGADLTVVFDAGQNSLANFDHLATTGLHYVGSVPASDCPDLTAIASAELTTVPGYDGLTCYDTRRTVYGTDRRTLLTHSTELHTAQARSFEDTTLATACRRLDELAATLARGKTRRTRHAVEAEVTGILRDTWVRRVITWQLTGDRPKDHRLTWTIDTTAKAALEAELFGKHVLITDQDDWTTTDVVAGYRSQSDAEFSFRQMKDTRVCSFSPMHHWTEHNIRVHLFTCVLALATAHLMRRHAAGHQTNMSVRALLDTLTGIQETVLIYPSTGGRPKARRITTEMTPDQQKLYEIFELHRWTPQT